MQHVKQVNPATNASPFLGHFKKQLDQIKNALPLEGSTSPLQVRPDWYISLGIRKMELNWVLVNKAPLACSMLTKKILVSRLEWVSGSGQVTILILSWIYLYIDSSVAPWSTMEFIVHNNTVLERPTS